MGSNVSYLTRLKCVSCVSHDVTHIKIINTVVHRYSRTLSGSSHTFPDIKHKIVHLYIVTRILFRDPMTIFSLSLTNKNGSITRRCTNSCDVYNKQKVVFKLNSVIIQRKIRITLQSNAICPTT